MTTGRPAEPIRAPRGSALSCKGWPQEAALRMLMNNLDPDVAERWEDLVVYGGSGKAARNWDAYRPHRGHAARARAPTRRCWCSRASRSASSAPTTTRRACSSPTPCWCPTWATGSTSASYEAMGLTMYGQMTAGSWIYIGTQGILQGTYETFGACAQKHFGGSLAGRLVLSAGLGGMGGAQPLAVTMNGGVALCRRGRSRAHRAAPATALRRSRDRLARRGARAGRRTRARGARRCRSRCTATRPRSIPSSPAAACARRGHRQTSAHDMLNGYVPAGLTLDEAVGAARARPRGVRAARARLDRRARCAPCSTLQRAGADPVRLRQQHPPRGGERRAWDDFAYPGFVPAYIRPLFCEGQGPFRWVALSGDPEDISATDARSWRRSRTTSTSCAG